MDAERGFADSTLPSQRHDSRGVFLEQLGYTGGRLRRARKRAFPALGRTAAGGVREHQQCLSRSLNHRAPKDHSCPIVGMDECYQDGIGDARGARQVVCGAGRAVGWSLPSIW